MHKQLIKISSHERHYIRTNKEQTKFFMLKMDLKESTSDLMCCYIIYEPYGDKELLSQKGHLAPFAPADRVQGDGLYCPRGAGVIRLEMIYVCIAICAW